MFSRKYLSCAIVAATQFQADNCEDMERLLTHVWASESDENLGESSDSEFSELGTEESDGESEKAFQSFEQNQDFSSEAAIFVIRGKCHDLLSSLLLLHRMVQKENEQQNQNHHRNDLKNTRNKTAS